MISVCCPFYPWWREHDRTEEIFNVLISSMNRCQDKHLLELSVVDGGTFDYWDTKEDKRTHDHVKFRKRITDEWEYGLKYNITAEVIHHRDGGQQAFWVARAIDIAVKQATNDKILIVGIDCELPFNIVDVVNSWVDSGKVMTLHAWNIRKDMPRLHRSGYGNWRGAKGIIAAVKEDYLAVGGAEATGMIKNRSDSLLYLKLKEMYELKEINPYGLFHIDHPGCNEGISEFKRTWPYKKGDRLRKGVEMHICVVGWYGHTRLYRLLKTVHYPVTIISHKDNDYSGLPMIKIPNVGLEFGCYDYFLKNVWNGQGGVLFMHDDMVINHDDIFGEIAKLQFDCSYIFRDKPESDANGGKHGRAIYCSERFLKFVKEFECDCEWCEGKEDVHHNKGSILPKLNPHKGFWFDPFNQGHISGKVPIGNRHYNSAIEHFHWFLGRVRDQRCGSEDKWPNPEVKMDVVNRTVFNSVVAGRRNTWKHMEREIKKYGT